MVDCYHTINNVSISENDADEIYNQTVDYLKLNPSKNTKEAIEEVLNQRSFNVLENKAIVKLNLDKSNAFIDFVSKGKGTPIDLIVRRPNAKIQSNNVETFASSHVEDFNSMLRKDLNSNEESILGDSNNDLNIIKAFDGVNTDSKYIKIANNLKEYFTYRDTKLVTSTAFKHRQLLDGYYFGVTHDSSAISKVSESEWVDFITPKLNVVKTSQLLGVPSSQLNESLSNIYKELESGIPLGTVSSQDLLKPNIRGIAHRSLIFKDLTSQYEYNKVFGEYKDLNGLIHNDFNRASKQIANSELLGSNPNEFVKNVLKDNRLFKNKKDQTIFKAIYNSYYDQTPVVASPTVRNITNTMRTISAIPRLFGALPFYTLEDIPQRILYLRNSGANVWDSVTAPFIYAMKDTSPQEIDFIKHYVDTFFSESIYNRSGLQAPKYLDKASKLVYHGFGLKAIERNQMKGLIAFKCRQLGTNSTLSYKELDEGLRYNLENHGIDKYDWDLIRSSVGKTGYVTPEQIETLSVPSQTKVVLRRKLRSLFLEAANNAVLSNGMYENALYSMGTKSGTPLGEAVRSVMQFKAFGLNFFRRVVVQQGKNAFALDRKLETALLYALTIVPLSFASNALLSLSKGLSPTNPFREKPREQIGYAEELLLGNIGSLISVINPTGNRSLTEKLLSTPLTKTVNKLYDSVIHIDHIPKNIVQTLNLDNTPIISVLLRSAFNEMNIDGGVPYPYKDDSQDYLFNN